MGWAEDVQAKYRAKAAAEAKANGAPKPKRPAPAASATQDGWELPGDHPDYLATAVVDELSGLAGTDPGGRNQQLYIAAHALGQFEDVDRDWLRGKLREACGSPPEGNGHLDDDGPGMVTGTIKSGFAKADEDVADNGWRDPHGPDGGVNVRIVSSIGGPTIASPNVGGANASAGKGAATSTSASTTGNATVHPITSAPSAGPSPLEPVMARIIAAEGDFWDRPSLRRVYDAALMQMVPPWALLANCSARAIALIPAKVRLAGVIGGLQGGSLNWFAAVVAESGSGKSAAQDLADELVPGYVDAFGAVHPLARNVGSGEGIVQAFVKTPAHGGKAPSPAVFHDAILFSADEIDSLTAQGARQGSVTLPILRQAFTGGTLGFAYAKTTNNTHLTKHTYRLAFVLSGQPTRYASLIADHHGGTPQRFMWFPGFDLRIADVDQTGFISRLAIPGQGDWAGVQVIQPPDEAKVLIRRERVKTGRGGGGFAVHEVFAREKFAQSLAVLDGHTEFSDDDWRLSGIAAAVSGITREWVQARLAGIDEEEDTKTGRRRAVVNDAADIEKRRRQSERKQATIDRVTNGIRRNLLKRPRTEGDLCRLAGPDIRERVPGMLKRMERDGEIEQCTISGARTTGWRFVSKQP